VNILFKRAKRKTQIKMRMMLNTKIKESKIKVIGGMEKRIREKKLMEMMEMVIESRHLELGEFQDE